MRKCKCDVGLAHARTTMLIIRNSFRAKWHWINSEERTVWIILCNWFTLFAQVVVPMLLCHRMMRARCHLARKEIEFAVRDPNVWGKPISSTCTPHQLCWWAVWGAGGAQSVNRYLYWSARHEPTRCDIITLSGSKNMFASYLMNEISSKNMSVVCMQACVHIAALVGSEI